MGKQNLHIVLKKVYSLFYPCTIVIGVSLKYPKALWVIRFQVFINVNYFHCTHHNLLIIIMNTTCILHFIHLPIHTNFHCPQKHFIYIIFKFLYFIYIIFSKIKSTLYFVKTLTKFYNKVVLNETLAARRNVEKRQK